MPAIIHPATPDASARGAVQDRATADTALADSLFRQLRGGATAHLLTFDLDGNPHHGRGHTFRLLDGALCVYGGRTYVEVDRLQLTRLVNGHRDG